MDHSIKLAIASFISLNFTSYNSCVIHMCVCVYKLNKNIFLNFKSFTKILSAIFSQGNRSPWCFHSEASKLLCVVLKVDQNSATS